MGTRVNVQVCVASVIETHLGEDQTEVEIIKALGH
jgi:hypothetical protein